MNLRRTNAGPRHRPLQRIERPFRAEPSGPTAEPAAGRYAVRSALKELASSQQPHDTRGHWGELEGPALVGLDASGRVNLVNAETCRLLNRERERMIGVDWFETCLPARWGDQMRRMFAQCMRTPAGLPPHFEHPVVTADGRHRLISWHNATVTDPEGRIMGVISSGEDITEKRRMQDALRESEQRLRNVVETAADGILTLDEAGTIQSFNPAAEAIFGYRAAEVIGHNIAMLISERHGSPDGLGMACIGGIGGAATIRREIHGVRKDGTAFPLELAVTPMQLRGRRQLTAIFRDITERQRLEREVLETSTQEQQRIGQDLHDGLGQELTSVSFMAGVLERKLSERAPDLAGEARAIAETVNRATEQTRALVRGLCPVNLGEGGLRDALHELADGVERRCQVRCVCRCDAEFSTNDPTAATHLYYIAQEAVTNAVRHGRATEIQMTLRRSSQQEQAELLVEDDGLGLSGDAQRSGGRGLRIMDYRSRMIGGRLEIGAATSGGTRVCCVFPVPRSAEVRGMQ